MLIERWHGGPARWRLGMCSPMRSCSGFGSSRRSTVRELIRYFTLAAPDEMFVRKVRFAGGVGTDGPQRAWKIARRHGCVNVNFQWVTPTDISENGQRFDWSP